MSRITRDAVCAAAASAPTRIRTNARGMVVRYRDIRNPSSAGCMRLVALVLVCASIDEIADQGKQPERNHNDHADDKRKIQAVRQGSCLRPSRQATRENPN